MLRKILGVNYFPSFENKIIDGVFLETQCINICLSDIHRANVPQLCHRDQFSDPVRDHNDAMRAALAFTQWLQHVNIHRSQRFKPLKEPQMDC